MYPGPSRDRTGLDEGDTKDVDVPHETGGDAPKVGETGTRNLRPPDHLTTVVGGERGVLKTVGVGPRPLLSNETEAVPDVRPTISPDLVSHNPRPPSSPPVDPWFRD